jgi:Na+/proline symporter
MISLLFMYVVLIIAYCVVFHRFFQRIKKYKIKKYKIKTLLDEILTDEILI